MDLERTRAKRTVAKLAKKLPVIEMLKAIPRIKSVGAPTLVAWIVDPGRFRSRSARSSYSGLGLGQGITNCLPGVRQGSRRDARGHRSARRSGPSAERAVRAATGNSNA
jgi:hypothetical protein